MPSVSTTRVDRVEFFETAKTITFSVMDEREAFELGYKNCLDSLKKSKWWESRYYIFRYRSEPVAVGIVQRDGELIYYVSSKVSHAGSIGLYRALRRITREIVTCCGGLVVEVARFHTQAIRLLKMLGFKLQARSNKSDRYALEEHGI